jgi:hypothetical protein
VHKVCDRLCACACLWLGCIGDLPPPHQSTAACSKGMVPDLRQYLCAAGSCREVCGQGSKHKGAQGGQLHTDWT